LITIELVKLLEIQLRAIQVHAVWVVLEDFGFYAAILHQSLQLLRRNEVNQPELPMTGFIVIDGFLG
jgi:hypothetical protein